MNRLYSSLLAATALTFTAAAQQLPNAGFEEAWVECVPWTSTKNTTPEGTTPTSWNVSNTIGTGSLGKTSIANNVEGYNSAGAVYVYNREITVLIVKKTIPGYFGLGTSWATSTGMGDNMAGGQFGGLNFVYRPDALQFMYKSSGAAEPTCVAYSWNGKFVQKDVSGNIVTGTNTTKVDMVDRDRCVLGMQAPPQGGEVTEKGKLIASINTRLEATTSDWTKTNLEFTYAANEVPEKINVIFSAGDYFSTTPVKDNSITVDDVKLIYYSRLKSLSVNGTAVADFDPNTYEYTVDAAMPTDASAIAAECLGNSGSGKAVVALDAANNKAIITVTNSNADMVGRASSDVTDIDGQTSHVYTLNFKSADTPAEVVESWTFVGRLTVDMTGQDLENTPVILNKLSDGTYTLLLEKFAATDENPGGLGDIVFDNVKLDGTSLSGKKDNIHLSDGQNEIDASGTLNGTLVGEELKLDLDIEWESIPIKVTFNGTRSTSAIGGIESDVIDENAPVEYYSIQGMKVNGDNLAPGFYIVRQGKKVSKIFVK